MDISSSSNSLKSLLHLCPSREVRKPKTWVSSRFWMIPVSWKRWKVSIVSKQGLILLGTTLAFEEKGGGVAGGPLEYVPYVLNAWATSKILYLPGFLSSNDGVVEKENEDSLKIQMVLLREGDVFRNGCCESEAKACVEICTQMRKLETKRRLQMYSQDSW